MQAPKRIYVDLDDVLCDTTRMLARLVENEFGRRIAYCQIASSDVVKSFGLHAGELRRFLKLAARPELLLSLPLEPGALGILQCWDSAGYEIWIVTGRSPSTFNTTRDWLSFRGVPYTCLQYVNKYSRVALAESDMSPMPLPDIAAVDFCLAIEDSPEVAILLAQGHTLASVLYARPWNVGATVMTPTGSRPIPRFSNWSDLGAFYVAP